MKKQWYVATLIVQCRVGDQQDGPFTCDEQIRLIRAVDAEEAYQKALQLGKGEEVVYQNSDGEDVFWEFVGLEDLEELFDKTISDGREIRSRLSEQDRPSELVCDKAALSVFVGMAVGD